MRRLRDAQQGRWRGGDDSERRELVAAPRAAAFDLSAPRTLIYAGEQPHRMDQCDPLAFGIFPVASVACDQLLSLPPKPMSFRNSERVFISVEREESAKKHLFVLHQPYSSNEWDTERIDTQ